MSDLKRKTLNYEQKHWYTYKPDKKKNSDVVQIQTVNSVLCRELLFWSITLTVMVSRLKDYIKWRGGIKNELLLTTPAITVR